jgi:hypothetical protein
MYCWESPLRHQIKNLSVANKPLNDKLREAAALWGWIYITGISNKFSGELPETIAHGYCADAERWV